MIVEKQEERASRRTWTNPLAHNRRALGSRAMHSNLGNSVQQANYRRGDAPCSAYLRGIWCRRTSKVYLDPRCLGHLLGLMPFALLGIVGPLWLSRNHWEFILPQGLLSNITHHETDKLKRRNRGGGHIPNEEYGWRNILQFHRHYTDGKEWPRPKPLRKPVFEIQNFKASLTITAWWAKKERTEVLVMDLFPRKRLATI